MQSAVSPLLARLLAAADMHARDEAWTEFVDSYSRLLLFVARKNAPDHDSAMDAYAFVLEKLREHGMRRLQSYAADGRGKFTTWLVVVTRRLCLDYHRHRYGRVPGADAPHESEDARAARRRLVELSKSSSADGLESRATDDDPEDAIRRAERDRALDLAMTGLAPADRLLLTLRFEDGLSAAEIASLMDFPSPFHVYRKLNHVLAALRVRLTELGVQSSVP